mmetsp:Transcript_50662/g.133815  ORF Transcript_50662/g.133815 Transcript_50662/m.133815 type:complete len:205 (-) Transcript_50662:77-691(-)
MRKIAWRLRSGMSCMVIPRTFRRKRTKPSEDSASCPQAVTMAMLSEVDALSLSSTCGKLSLRRLAAILMLCLSFPSSLVSRASVSGGSGRWMKSRNSLKSMEPFLSLSSWSKKIWSCSSGTACSDILRYLLAMRRTSPTYSTPEPPDSHSLKILFQCSASCSNLSFGSLTLVLPTLERRRMKLRTRLTMAVFSHRSSHSSWSTE